MSQTPIYGGQAILEGVMFGGKEHTVSAIRRNDQSIEYYYAKKTVKPWMNKLKKVPFIRGNIAIIEAAGIGSKHLQFSSERYDVAPGEEQEGQELSKLEMIFGVAIVGILSFLFGKFVFTLVPVFLAELFSPWISGKYPQIFLETGIKLILLLTYLYLISLTPIIRRVFQYHGAEHKVINCYEQGLELTVENVQKQSRLHYRCGSSFILFTVIIGMFIYLLFPVEPLWFRVLIRILLIPVVLGVSYEVLQFTNSLRDVPVLRFMGYPGLWLQLLTTKEPDDQMVEVSIASFKKLHEIEKNPEIALRLHHD
ncbi:DUF1385 domain-containing protein [Ureibacillus sp. FSL K6-8385]|uniref:DUF1385 domain-containing protein n=1 Tax=Ureibacillus terrenus TaxID=118246 RepID=A0A540V675_9BACL|nr:DUF1385 domain-containing protein [Ureibacillus terrenus]MED3660751.1 DUF1385 domain-containing protein [Ureibacillus terrenus]MED3762939.1 DUF1385 domain-containing protein [Ureibacillus terrenus]TQE92259.1 DUF1385 domain-containing protein [Ureibacillus terrenus]